MSYLPWNWHRFHFSIAFWNPARSSSPSGDGNYSTSRNSTSDDYMIDRNSRDSVIIITTADAVSLRGTAGLWKFPQRRNLQHTRRTLSASEITTLSGIIVIWKQGVAGRIWERGLIAESVSFQTRRVGGRAVLCFLLDSARGGSWDEVIEAD